ncbi:hypothetical protein [Terrisporobacter mayombei]|uniref:Uncharacterized protein n=1 Tax=Terrisporobacter mayombei TaxID=1541 RepID=A0ABY9PZJ3_9FIRM|nr:hypothetical protein [Terrisporobacter mayombei]MCC3866898.1 hypothetical protein [Terrisporobacter mayombei]WMT81142.1 hypothetical protein TEMA_14740 [Terrisporobacter mayombei]
MNIKDLANSIKKVIYILEKEYASQLTSGLLELIYKRYVNAIICITNKDLRDIKISGGVRAYLDSYSNYTCTLVIAMDEAETLYEDILKKI